MFRDIFASLIKSGEFTKTELLHRIKQIQSFNKPSLEVISQSEYDYIVGLINNSSLPL